MKSSILKLIHEVEDRITLINGDLIEPLNMYIQHYSTTTDVEFEKIEAIGTKLTEKYESLKKN